MMRYAVFLILLALLPVPAYPDIYRYVDEDGVIHFTDVPMDEEAVVVQREAVQTGSSSSYSRREIRRIAEEAARRHSLDPQLVKAVIQVESGWDPFAVSRRGAMGLMQLMPATVKEMGVRNPYDPEENINAGVRYLKALIDRFGDIELALAAYNAGPKVVERYGAVPPYRETVHYVRDILHRYNGGGAVKKERIFRVVLEDGTVLFTNSPLYLKGYSSF